MTRPSFKMSPDTRLLRQELDKLAVGDLITYADLSAAISSPVTSTTPALRSAMNSLLRAEEKVFAVVRGQGYIRLDDASIVDKSESNVRKVRRAAQRSLRELVAVQDYSKLDNKRQLIHTTRVAVLTATAEITSNRGLKKIEAVAGSSKELPIRETLAAFK